MTPIFVPEGTSPMSNTNEPGFLVRGRCGREWFVPFAAVGNDYALFLMEQDGLSQADATAEAEANRDFWPTWFAEQCCMWVDIERLGKLVKKSTLFKTKAALDRHRGRGHSHVDDYDRVGIDEAIGVAECKSNSPTP